MIKPPKELVDRFFLWFKKDPHFENEDYYADKLSKDRISSMTKQQFMDFFSQFATEGGKIQSGGERTKNLFLNTITSQYDSFYQFIFQSFDPDLDVAAWLKKSKDFKYFGSGLATIFLNRVNKYKYPVVNNKTSDAMALFGIKLPVNLVKKFEIVKSSQQQLIDWYPEFDNFFRTDALTHYLIGVDDGAKLAGKLLTGISPGIRYWICALGPGAKFWDECREQNIAVFGFNELEPLSSYKSKEAIANAITRATKRKRPTNDALAGWQIANEVKKGDVFIAKRGESTYLGYGFVSGEYYYDPHRSTYKNVIPVDWKVAGDWEETEGRIVLKTLTDITPDPDYVRRLMEMFGAKKDGNQERLPLNLILYGPPGTGKTYRLKTEFFEKFTDPQKVKTKGMFAEEIAAQFSMWELLAMVLIDRKEATVTEIMQHPFIEARFRNSRVKRPRNSVWGELQLRTREDCELVQVAKRAEPKLFWKDAKSVWSIKDIDSASEELEDLFQKLNDYKNFVQVTSEEKRYFFTTFHQSYSYEEFVEGIKPRLEEETEGVAGDISYEIKPGIFKQIVDMARKNKDKSYAVFIDEISRGNVASIFGELITLIEDDKRLNAKNELWAKLPYSREDFVVPPNLHIIGTMNTADRSVVALDNALRRRFSFIEMMPEPEMIEQPADFDVDLRQLLITINGRIERLLDRDHVIGHSYFMGISEVDDPLKELQHVFANKVIPLLQEYFYGDPGKIGMILGDGFVKVENNGIPFARGSWDVDGWDERPIYRFVSPYLISVEDFKNIYAS